QDDRQQEADLGLHAMGRSAVMGPERATGRSSARRSPSPSVAGGTGSQPRPPHGWQRAILRTASHPPRTAPWRSSASNAYAEHVGVYRQAGGVQGETAAR